MSFLFHAAPPPGEWINDPNGLVFSGGRYRLFVQHSAAPPEYRAIGWARFSSDDLVRWDWDGCVIPPDEGGLAYSGSVTPHGNELTAYLTRHNPAGQKQYKLSSSDTGKHWKQDPAALGPAGKNVRDPFVFDCVATGDRRMILAEPCDWHGWAKQPPSTLSIWRERAKGWELVGKIGPWSPPGVMWEVPVLLDFGEQQVLIVSMVDRRGGGARCSVRYWTGRFDGCSFVTQDALDGQLLDFGPDFYATCVNSVANWPVAGRTLVAWASSWGTARGMPWPKDLHGGPISLPRNVSLQNERLHQDPLAAAIPRAARERWEPGTTAKLQFTGNNAALHIDINVDGSLGAERSGESPTLAWRHTEAHFVQQPTDILLFVDSGLIEIFFVTEGKTLTAFVPGAVFDEGKTE